MIMHSFAVMAYKDSPYLPPCLDSLAAQTFKSRIFITTSTPSAYIDDIARKYGIEVYITNAGKGIAHDWNFSLHQANTKYVTLAHQDDLYLPAYAEKCISAGEHYPDTLICFTGYEEIIEDQKRSSTLLLHIKRVMIRAWIPVGNAVKSKMKKKLLFAAGCPIAAPSVMYNLENINGFEFSNDFSINMDWDAWSRLARMTGRFVYVNENLLAHRIHPDSATTAGIGANQRQQEDLKMFKRFWPGFIAHTLAALYKRSYKSNVLKTERQTP